MLQLINPKNRLLGVNEKRSDYSYGAINTTDLAIVTASGILTFDFLAITWSRQNLLKEESFLLFKNFPRVSRSGRRLTLLLCTLEAQEA